MGLCCVAGVVFGNGGDQSGTFGSCRETIYRFAPGASSCQLFSFSSVAKRAREVLILRLSPE